MPSRPRRVSPSRARLRRILRGLGLLPRLPLRARIGRQGEARARRALRRRGYRILARRWRTRHGEIDLLAYDPPANMLVVVEVKSSRVAPLPVLLTRLRPAQRQRLARIARGLARALHQGHAPPRSRGQRPRAVRVDIAYVHLASAPPGVWLRKDVLREGFPR